MPGSSSTMRIAACDNHGPNSASTDDASATRLSDPVPMISLPPEFYVVLCLFLLKR